MHSRNEALVIAQEEVRKGTMTTAQANVYMVQLEGVRVVTGKISADVRAALNAAVKSGELGHIKKDGLLPEVYHHKNGKANAITMRRKVALESVEAIKTVLA
jgi:hypothetical protein